MRSRVPPSVRAKDLLPAGSEATLSCSEAGLSELAIKVNT